MSLPTIWKYIDRNAFNKQFKKKYAKEKLRRIGCRVCIFFTGSEKMGNFSGMCEIEGFDYVVISFHIYPNSGQNCNYHANKNKLLKHLVDYPTN